MILLVQITTTLIQISEPLQLHYLVSRPYQLHQRMQRLVKVRELKFVITSDYRPRNAQNSLDVKYEVTQAGGFIDPTLDITLPITATGLVFMEVGGGSTDWMAEIDIPLRVKDKSVKPRRFNNGHIS